jgi:hypothetical protein
MEMHEELKKVISQAMNTRFELEQKLIERAWEDEKFKQELLSNPKAVFEKESGQELPKDIEIEVIQETDNKAYLVLPINPVPAAKTEEEISEEALEAVAGGVSGCVRRTKYSGSVCVMFSAVKNANNLA